MELEPATQYVKNILGVDMNIEKLPAEKTGKLPFYVNTGYDFYRSFLYGRTLTIVEPKDKTEQSLSHVQNQLHVIEKNFDSPVILIAKNISSIQRKRLIERKINFIIPGKQLFIPALLLDLREQFIEPEKKNEKLLPSAQVILFYKILNWYEKIETLNFKELAEKFGYTQMGISKAIENLKYHELCKVAGGKDKNLVFEYNKHELWNRALPLLVSPIIKSVYIDELPHKLHLFSSGISALPEYTDIAEPSDSSYAIEKYTFYGLEKLGDLKNLNNSYGQYNLEIWKYDPKKLSDMKYEGNVDPLSLYISLKDSHDERVEMALEKILEEYTV